MEIATALALDSKTLNLLGIDETAVISISGIICNGSNNLGDQSHSVSAFSVRELTGEKSSVTLKRTEKDIQICFEDSAAKVLEHYQLTVLLNEEHILGSPFQLQFVDFNTALSDDQALPVSLIDAQHKTNIVFPITMGENVKVEVDGPCGVCDISTTHWPKLASSVSFIPPAAGAYELHVTPGDSHYDRLSYSIFADFSSEEAQQCSIMESDRYLFEKPIPFKNQSHAFRVMTKNAELRLHDGTRDQTNISAICHGHKEMAVHVRRDVDFPGTETCTITPSMPGEYTLNILWKKKPIHGSPIKMTFSCPHSNTVTYEGEELNKVAFKIGEQYTFNISTPDSSSVESDGLEVLCTPSGTASIRLDPLNVDKSVYKCEVYPLREGRHEIHIKYEGEHITGSPFLVSFNDVADAQLCKVVEVVRDAEKTGFINAAVSTEGAGPGIMEAKVKVVAKNGKWHTSEESTEAIVQKTNSTMHLVQFHLGEGVASLIEVLYNGRHIHGSPYKLVFADFGKVRATGRGLVAGRVGEWNSFALQTTGSEAPEMEPTITVVSEAGLIAEVQVLSSTQVSSESLESLDSFSVNSYVVRYRPTAVGRYKIDIAWGFMPVAGSPFFIDCFSHGLEVCQPPDKLVLGSTIDFDVTIYRITQIDICDLELDAKQNKNGTLSGKITGPFSKVTGDVLTCSLAPKVAGKYVVGVKWKGLHIRGSPFCVKILEPPRPEAVLVHGAGVADGVIGKQEFTVETAAAGMGSLTMTVSKVLSESEKERIPLQVSQDAVSRRTLYASYDCTTAGEYIIDVLWAGEHVPGSPFEVEHLHPNVRTATIVAVSCDSNNDSFMGTHYYRAQDEFQLVPLKKQHERDKIKMSGTAVKSVVHLHHSNSIDNAPIFISSGSTCNICIKID